MLVTVAMSPLVLESGICLESGQKRFIVLAIVYEWQTKDKGRKGQM